MQSFTPGRFVGTRGRGCAVYSSLSSCTDTLTGVHLLSYMYRRRLIAHSCMLIFILNIRFPAFVLTLVYYPEAFGRNLARAHSRMYSCVCVPDLVTQSL